MASRITNLALKNKVREFILTNPNDKSLNSLIEEAIINADRDLHNVDSLYPLAWDIHPYDELRTNYYAKISAITQANPGVITAASIDSDTSGHGFNNHATIRDVVVIDNVEDMEELNKRAFLLEYVDADTFSLKSLDGLSDIDTTNYTEYDSSGVVYHAGFVLNATTILTDVSSEWTIKQLMPSPSFDGFYTDPITDDEARDQGWWDISLSTRPTRYRYWQNMTDPDTPTVNHYLLWYPVCDKPYNIFLKYQKEVPDISTFDDSTYPFHPPQLHDALWHGALAKLVGLSKRVERQTAERIVTKMEIAWAERWITEWRKDKIRAIELSRKLLGDIGGFGGFSG